MTSCLDGVQRPQPFTRIYVFCKFNLQSEAI